MRASNLSRYDDEFQDKYRILKGSCTPIYTSEGTKNFVRHCLIGRDKWY